ncbi:MAG: LysM peptidoglycan-binding domain-containing protein [Nocardioides sp.]
MSTIAVTHVPLGRRPARTVRSAHAGRPVGSVRLTRRGRAVVLLGVSCSCSRWPSSPARAPRPPTCRVRPSRPGWSRWLRATRWGIASELATDGDVRAMVDTIERLNALDSAMLQAGQELRVPVG